MGVTKLNAHIHLSVFMVNHYIVRLDVPMHDSHAVAIIQSLY